MNWLDIVILVAIAVATFFGLRIGIIKAALSLAGLIVGVILAGRYYIPLSQQLSFIPQANIAKIVAFAIILIGVMIIAAVAAVLLKWAVSKMMLGWVNQLGGAVFGLVLGAIFCGALLAIWVKFVGIEGAIAESTLAAILLDRFPIVLALLPGEFDAVRSFFQ
ncbi:MAG: CvpA family protein [Dehalococcoidia bacterium]|nr:CvpA family protein [Dehalococcoidia bacterium]